MDELVHVLATLLTNDEGQRNVEFHADISIAEVFLSYEDEKFWITPVKDVGRGRYKCDCTPYVIYYHKPMTASSM